MSESEITTWLEDFERRLQDDEFALAYAEEDRQCCKITQRTVHSKWCRLWKLYYKIMPARITGL